MSITNSSQILLHRYEDILHIIILGRYMQSESDYITIIILKKKLNKTHEINIAKN